MDAIKICAKGHKYILEAKDAHKPFHYCAECDATNAHIALSAAQELATGSDIRARLEFGKRQRAVANMQATVKIGRAERERRKKVEVQVKRLAAIELAAIKYKATCDENLSTWSQLHARQPLFDLLVTPPPEAK